MLKMDCTSAVLFRWPASSLEVDPIVGHRRQGRSNARRPPVGHALGPHGDHPVSSAWAGDRTAGSSSTAGHRRLGLPRTVVGVTHASGSATRDGSIGCRSASARSPARKTASRRRSAISARATSWMAAVKWPRPWEGRRRASRDISAWTARGAVGGGGRASPSPQGGASVPS